MFDAQFVMFSEMPSVTPLAAVAMRIHSSRASVGVATVGSMVSRRGYTSSSTQSMPRAWHASVHEPSVSDQIQCSPGGGGGEGGGGEGGGEGGEQICR